jgi:hypothetical protein
VAAKTGEFALTGTTGNVAVTGVGFQPTIVFFTWESITTGGAFNGPGDSGMSFGWMTDGNGQGHHSTKQEDNANPNNSYHTWSSQHCIGAVSTTGTVGHAQFVSMDSDGFTVNVTDGFPTTTQVYYMALDAAGQFQSSWIRGTLASAGEQSFTGVGFQPTSLITLGGSGGVNGNFTSSANMYWQFGVASSTTASDMWTAGMQTRDNQITGEVKTYGISDYTNTRWGTTSVGTHYRISSFDSDGFTTDNVVYTSVFERFAYLAMADLEVKAGTTLTRTDTTQWSVTGVGFQPQAIIFFSTGKAESTLSTVTNDQRMSVGFAAGTADRAAVGMVANDIAAAPTEIWRGKATDCCLVLANQSDTIDAKMDLVSFDSDGFTLVMDDADTVASFVGYIAIGQAIAASAGGPFKAGGRSFKRSINNIRGPL